MSDETCVDCNRTASCGVGARRDLQQALVCQQCAKKYDSLHALMNRLEQALAAADEEFVWPRRRKKRP